MYERSTSFHLLLFIIQLMNSFSLYTIYNKDRSIIAMQKNKESGSI